jgi:hypothetical protein
MRNAERALGVVRHRHGWRARAAIRAAVPRLVSVCVATVNPLKVWRRCYATSARDDEVRPGPTGARPGAGGMRSGHGGGAAHT